MRSITVAFIALSLLPAVQPAGVSIPGCESGRLEAEEGGQDVVLKCSGLDITLETTWGFTGRYLGNVPETVATCRVGQATHACTSDYNNMILASTNQNTARSHVIIPNILRGRFPDGTWTCQNGGSTATCSLDVVYSPRDVECDVTVDENSGTVSGTCVTSKMFSSQGVYSCAWYEGGQNQTDREISRTWTLADCAEQGRQFQCGTCNFNTSLPSLGGGYRYRAVIFPGNINPPVTLIAVLTRPATSPSPSPNSTSHSSQGGTGPTSNPSNPTTQHPPRIVVDIDIEERVRMEGIGLGAGATLLAVGLVALLVLLVRRWKQNSEEQDQQWTDGLPPGLDNGGYEHPVTSDFKDELDKWNSSQADKGCIVDIPNKGFPAKRLPDDSFPAKGKGKNPGKGSNADDHYATIPADNGPVGVPSKQDPWFQEKLPPICEPIRNDSLRSLPPVPKPIIRLKHIHVTEAVTSTVAGGHVGGASRDGTTTSGGCHDGFDDLATLGQHCEYGAINPLPKVLPKSGERLEAGSDHLRANAVENDHRLKDAEYLYMDMGAVEMSEPM